MDEGHVVITLGELKLEATGSVEILRRTIAEFFVQLAASKRGNGVPIATRQKSVREILMDLRDGGFFDEPKDTAACDRRLRELGKTDITRNAVAMALKALVEAGDLARRGSGKTFDYVSPAVGS